MLRNHDMNSRLTNKQIKFERTKIFDSVFDSAIDCLRVVFIYVFGAEIMQLFYFIIILVHSITSEIEFIQFICLFFG